MELHLNDFTNLGWAYLDLDCPQIMAVEMWKDTACPDRRACGLQRLGHTVLWNNPVYWGNKLCNSKLLREHVLYVHIWHM